MTPEISINQQLYNAKIYRYDLMINDTFLQTKNLENIFITVPKLYETNIFNTFITKKGKNLIR